MAVLNLRGLPKELVARVKSQAALDGKTIVKWVRWVLEAQFNGQATVSADADRRRDGAVGGSAKDGSGGIAQAAGGVGVSGDEVGHSEAGVGAPNGLGLRECPNCGKRLFENRKLRKRGCEDEQCGYREPIR